MHDIRQRAEEITCLDNKTIARVLSLDEAQLLIHELRLHQVELEMQNEEMRRIQVSLETSRTSYFDLYDLAPVGYLTINDTGLIQRANLSAATLLGISRNVLSQNALSQFIFPEDQDVYYLHRKRVFETAELQTCEIRMVRSNGVRFWTHLRSTPGNNGEYWITLADINERKQAVDKLRESEQFTTNVMDSLTANIAVLDSKGIIVFVNSSWLCFAREYGDFATIPNDVGKNYLDICRDSIISDTDGSAKAAYIGITDVLLGANDNFKLEYSCHSPYVKRWFMLSATKLKGSRGGVVVSHSDITFRKQLGDSLQKQ